MDATIRAYSHFTGKRPKVLRILDIGGGVIEPFLLAALVRARFPETACRILVVDPSEDVHSILLAACAGQRWERLSGGETLVGFDPRSGRFPLSSLARLFSSPEDTVNPHLVDAAALAGSVSELARLGILGVIGLPEDPTAAVRELSEIGLPVPPASVVLIEPSALSILDIKGGAGPFDLIVANFSLQYPIVEGAADEVAARLCALLAPRGIFAHGATYAAQVLCAQALLACRVEICPVAFGIREIDEVHYVNDPEGKRLRLRIRTDAIYCRPSEGEPGRVVDGVFPLFPDQLSSADVSLHEAVRAMDRADGLVRSQMVACMKWSPNDHCTWSRVERKALLDLPFPLPYRIEWRRSGW